MKILFFGRGVIGTQYAWAFEKAGHIVEFYVRKGKKEQYGSHVNLEILDTRRSKKDRLVKEQWPITTNEDIEEMHDYDLIFVSVNPEQVAKAAAYLAPQVGNATVLFFGNFWKDIQKSTQPLPFNQVIWGFPGSGGGYEKNTLYGGLYKTVHFGISGSKPKRRDLELHKLFSEAGFKVKVHGEFQDWLRNHFISNAAMEMEVLKNGSFKKVISSQQALVGMVQNTKEMVSVLKANGVKLDTQMRMMGLLPATVLGFLMSNLIFSPGSIPSLLVEHNHYSVGYSVQEMIAEARKHHLKTPRLDSVESLI